MSFLTSLDIGKNALSAQRLRMDVITQNIANAETTRTTDGGPYRRQLVVFEERTSFKQLLGDKRKKLNYEGVNVAAVVKDESDFVPVYDPTHPDANEDGYVMMPNVDRTKEMLDLMAATRSYEANITAINAVKAMATRALQIGK
jgi:flagellar basal-body rod protein FlgC